MHQVSLEAEARAEAYVPALQSEVRGGNLLVRTSGDPYRVLPQVKAALHGVMPDVPLRGVRTMEEVISRQTAQRRLNMLLLGLFGLLGLVIAAVGIYGVMAYVVSQRTREIGVRMALGATRGNVVGMVMRNASLMVALGLAIGGAGAWYLSAAARTFLFRLDADRSARVRGGGRDARAVPRSSPARSRRGAPPASIPSPRCANKRRIAHVRRARIIDVCVPASRSRCRSRRRA